MLFIDRDIYETIPLQFPRCFSLKKKTVWEKLISLNVCKALAKRWGCKLKARNSYTCVTSDWTYHFSPSWKTYRSRFRLDASCFFFLRVKTSFAPFIGENSLAYENLRHRSAFSWLFLSMYKIKPLTWQFHLFYNFTAYYHLLEKPYPQHSKRNELMIHISSTWSSFSC